MIYWCLYDDIKHFHSGIMISCSPPEFQHTLVKHSTILKTTIKHLKNCVCVSLFVHACLSASPFTVSVIVSVWPSGCDFLPEAFVLWLSKSGQ